MRATSVLQLRRNAILLHHLARALVLWVILEGIGIGVAYASTRSFRSMLNQAARYGLDLHVPTISVMLVDATAIVMALIVYRFAGLRRLEDRILLGNLGITPMRFAAYFDAVAAPLAICTWVLR